MKKTLVACAMLALAGTCQSAVVESADVGGFRTFVDTTTGTVWADLDNFLVFTGTAYVWNYASMPDYLGALQAAGFTWATSGQVAALTASLPMATTADFIAIGNVMDSLSFGEFSDIDADADAGGGITTRHFAEANWGAGTSSWRLGSGTPWPTTLDGSGLWAYIAAPGGGGSVPEPATLALAGLALAAAGMSRMARR